jgi:hypothetical protein
MEFVGGTLHILAFCLPLPVGSVTEISGYPLPFALYVPFVPFELVVGIWILARGIERRTAGPSPVQPSLS